MKEVIKRSGRYPWKSDLDAEKVYEIYKQGFSIEEIANILGQSEELIKSLINTINNGT